MRGRGDALMGIRFFWMSSKADCCQSNQHGKSSISIASHILSSPLWIASEWPVDAREPAGVRSGEARAGGEFR